MVSGLCCCHGKQDNSVRLFRGVLSRWRIWWRISAVDTSCGLCFMDTLKTSSVCFGASLHFVSSGSCWHTVLRLVASAWTLMNHTVCIFLFVFRCEGEDNQKFFSQRGLQLYHCPPQQRRQHAVCRCPGDTLCSEPHWYQFSQVPKTCKSQASVAIWIQF